MFKSYSFPLRRHQQDWQQYICHELFNASNAARFSFSFANLFTLQSDLAVQWVGITAVLMCVCLHQEKTLYICSFVTSPAGHARTFCLVYACRLSSFNKQHVGSVQCRTFFSFHILKTKSIKTTGNISALHNLCSNFSTCY